MHFHKQPSPFSLAPITDLKQDPQADPPAGTVVLQNAQTKVTVRALRDDIFEFVINRQHDPLPHHTPPLAAVPEPDVNAQLKTATTPPHVITLTNSAGSMISLSLDGLAIGLSTKSQKSNDSAPVELIKLDHTQHLGFNGDKFGIGLRMPDQTPYYGFGEKTGSLNKHGQRMKFWNVDVCADLPDGCQTDHYDPTYGAIPVGIWHATNDKGSTAYAAVFIDNGGPAFFNCQTQDFGEPDLFYFGTYVGEPRFYFILGATMAEVTTKLLRLTGTPEMPPLWAFANQQCRWGYDEERMYKRIIDAYIEERIPLHGFWLDIDYMEEYQVFSWHEERVPEPEALSKWMHERGVHMVTIVDPGVPTRDDNNIFVDGSKKDLFCHAPSGELFVGIVWPGKTVFPDYSMPEVRTWWGDLIAKHLARGVCGIWNDMNDPATGMSDVDDMLFERGTIEHAHYHNLYGTYMAEATYLGFRQHAPHQRPFILTRSASTGVQQFAAVWTGDNVSSWAHLKMSIPETLNLALSGVSFNGADIGGFMESTTAELLTRWYQAAVLFPFYRNHSNTNTAHQEPWCFGTNTREIIRETIVLRYRFIAQIYTQFAQHIHTGEPLVRPLCYFSPDEVFRDVSTSYALGDSIVVTPIVEEGVGRRYVVLPPGKWFDLSRRTWHDGGQIFERTCALEDIPIYIKDGSIICEPLPADDTYVGWDCNLEKVRWRLHLYLSPDNQSQSAIGTQLIDDGISFLARDKVPALTTIKYQAGTLSGTFPFERLSEISINGLTAAHEDPNSNDNTPTPPTAIQTPAHTFNATAKPPLESILRPTPLNGHEDQNNCRLYRCQ